jgi:imidazolonepropionase-like amidohydrolase
LLRLEELLDDAAALTRAGARALEISEALAASRRDLEVMALVGQGALPLVIDADQASDIEAVLRLQARRKLKVILVGGAEAWLVAPQLAAAKVPVVIRPFVYGPGSFDQIHGREDNGALLRAAGVEVIIGAGDTHNARAMRFAAGNAVRGGMSHADALRAITEAPAAAFNLGGRGRIAVGAPADLALWTGDPLDIAGRLSAVWIDGVGLPLTTRQTALVDRWRDVQPVWGE